jgi:hypothetical protein
MENFFPSAPLRSRFDRSVTVGIKKGKIQMTAQNKGDDIRTLLKENP